MSFPGGWRTALPALRRDLVRRPVAVDGMAAVLCILITGPIMMLVKHQSALTNMRWAGAASAVSCLALLGAHRWPRLTVWYTAATSGVVFSLLPTAPPPSASAVAALFLLASRTDRPTVVRHSVGVGLALTLDAFAVRAEVSALAANLAILAWTQLPSALGDAVRSRRELLESYRARAEHAEETREAEAIRRVEAERLRIACELHDVVTHHLTLVNAQAGVAHHLLLHNPTRAHEALGQIRDTSRAALDALRAIVGLLRRAEETDQSRLPTPGIADIPALLDSFRHAGLPVDVVQSGRYDTLPPFVELTAYRVAQEALTNAGKHGGGTSARLRIAVHATSLEVTVVDDGDCTRARGEGTGLGLISLRERVQAVGGTLSSGPRPEGGFRVHAILPIPEQARAARVQEIA